MAVRRNLRGPNRPAAKETGFWRPHLPQIVSSTQLQSGSWSKPISKCEGYVPGN
jgi:hypothetical protein